MAQDLLYLYRDPTGAYRWTYTRNGRTIADSGQGYTRRLDALHGASIVTGQPLPRDPTYTLSRPAQVQVWQITRPPTTNCSPPSPPSEGAHP